jgi:hypothetical protein
MPDVEGYPMMWPVAGALILAGAATLRTIGSGSEEAGRRHDAEQAA